MTEAQALDRTGVHLRFTLDDNRVVKGYCMKLDEQKNELLMYHSEVVEDPDSQQSKELEPPSRPGKRWDRSERRVDRTMQNSNLRPFLVRGEHVKEMEYIGRVGHRGWSNAVEVANTQRNERRWPPARSSKPPKPILNNPPSSFQQYQRSTEYWSIDLPPHFTSELQHSPLMQILQQQEGLTPKLEFHVTLVYLGRRGTAAEEQPFRAIVGKSVPLKIKKAVSYNGLACASVDILDPSVAKLCKNAHPHITLALAPGVQAKYSNDTLAMVAKGWVSFQWELNLDVCGVVAQHC